jgi:hypothetical protein
MEHQQSSTASVHSRIFARIGALPLRGLRCSFAPYLWLLVLYLCALAALRSS